MTHPEHQYLDLLRDCLENGVYREGRNGGTYGLFGRQIRFDLSQGFPLLTTKRVHFKSIAVELLWFLRGDTNVKFLQEHGVTIWDEWADENGNLGPVYGSQWRFWTAASKSTPVVRPSTAPFISGCVAPPAQPEIEVVHGTIDQIAKLIEGLILDPNGRRHIVTAWNPDEIDGMALPPCHCLFQFFVANGKLSCQLYQRSADVFLGVPFNIASYALLVHLIAREVDMQVGEFVHTFGDVHLYANHVEQAREQLSRTPRPFPELLFDSWTPALAGLQPVHLTSSLYEYDPHPAIKAEVSK